MSLTLEEQFGSLTAREIFNRIFKGETVRVPADFAATVRLTNYLNVIKSREKRLYLDLGLKFTSSVINVVYTDKGFFEINLAVSKKKIYPCLVIKAHDSVTS